MRIPRLLCNAFKSSPRPTFIVAFMEACLLRRFCGKWLCSLTRSVRPCQFPTMLSRYGLAHSVSPDASLTYISNDVYCRNAARMQP